MSLNLTGSLTINMQVNNAGVGAALSQTQGQLHSLNNAAKNTKKEFAAVAGAFTSLWVARGIAGALFGMIRPAIEMDEALARMRVTTGAAANELEGYRRAATKAAGATKFSPVEAVEGLSQLALAGVRGRDAFDAILPVMELAQAREWEVAEAAQVAGAVFRQFRLSGDDLTLALDQVQGVSALLGVNLRSPIDVVTKLGQVASQTGDNFRDLYLTFGMASRGMASSTRAATDVLALFSELADPGKRASMGAAFGINSEDEHGRFKRTADLVSEIAQRYGQLTDSDRQLAVHATGLGRTARRAFIPMLDGFTHGVKGIVDLNGHVLTGIALWRELQRRADGMAGSLDKAAKIALNTFNGQLSRLKENIDSVFMILATPATTKLTGAFAWLGDVVDSIQDMKPATLAAAQSWFGWTAAVVGFGVALMVVAGATRIFMVGMRFTAGVLLPDVVRGFVRARVAALLFGSGLTTSAERFATFKSRMLQGGVAISAFLAGFGVMRAWLRDIASDLKSAGNAGQAFNVAILEEVEAKGYLASVTENLTDLFKQQFDLDVRHVSVQQQRREATEALTAAQEEYNGSLDEYYKRLNKALSQEFPPRIQERNLLNAERLLNRNSRSLNDMQRMAASAGRQAIGEIRPLFDIMRTGGRLTGQQMVQLTTALTSLRNASGLMGTEGRKTAEALTKDVQASIAMQSQENVFNTDTLRQTAGGSAEAEQAATARLGLDRLSALHANIQQATLNVQNLDPGASDWRRETFAPDIGPNAAVRATRLQHETEGTSQEASNLMLASMVSPLAIIPAISRSIEAISASARAQEATARAIRAGQLRPVEAHVTIETTDGREIPDGRSGRRF